MNWIERVGATTVSGLCRLGDGGLILAQSLKQSPSLANIVRQLYQLISSSLLGVVLLGFFVGMLALRGIVLNSGEWVADDDAGERFIWLVVDGLSVPLVLFQLLLSSCADSLPVSPSLYKNRSLPLREVVLDRLIALQLVAPLLLAFFIVATIAGMTLINQLSLHLNGGVLIAATRSALNESLLCDVWLRIFIEGLFVFILICIGLFATTASPKNVGEDSGICFVLGFLLVGITFAELFFGAFL